MNRLKNYIDEYFIDSLAKFCVDNKIENIQFTLKIELIWSYVFLDWGDDFSDFVDAYGDYQWEIRNGKF